MMDHSHDHASVDGPWAGGWAVALVAGALVALVARGFGDTGLVATLIVGVVTFGVYGVLLGSGGVEVTVTAASDDHGHH